MQAFIRGLQKYVDRPWYPWLLAAMGIIDTAVFVIPSDGILISSCMLVPRRWFRFGAGLAIGSTIGAFTLAVLVEKQGLPFILHYYPGIDQTETWSWASDFFARHGLLFVFAFAVTPLMQHPVVIIAGLAQAPLGPLAIALFTGRLIKFLIVAYLGSHAPKLVSRLWGLKGEIRDAGVKIKD